MAGRTDPPSLAPLPRPLAPRRPARSPGAAHAHSAAARGRRLGFPPFRQGHVAGPLLSQGLMHGESCPCEPGPRSCFRRPRLRGPRRASLLRGSLPSSGGLRRTASVARLQPKCLLLPSPLLPPSSPASLCSGETQQRWRSEQRRALAQDPSPPSPSAPLHPSYPPPASQARQGAVLAHTGARTA